jgi:Ca2+-dependent lipid-binding protein
MVSYRDEGEGKMDPFVKLSFGGQTFETKVAENQGRKPTWNEVFKSAYNKAAAELKVEAFDKDAKSSDLIGAGKCSLAEVKKSRKP